MLVECVCLVDLDYANAYIYKQHQSNSLLGLYFLLSLSSRLQSHHYQHVCLVAELNSPPSHPFTSGKGLILIEGELGREFPSHWGCRRCGAIAAASAEVAQGLHRHVVVGAHKVHKAIAVGGALGAWRGHHAVLGRLEGAVGEGHHCVAFGDGGAREVRVGG